MEESQREANLLR